MEFRIADTFTDSLGKLTAHEQKAAKTTAFDLQLNPAGPGLQLHRLENVKDQNFWSVRVNNDIRIIIHRTYSSLLLCYVDHHDKAYDWARRRKLEIHPATGAAQLVEVRELVREIVVDKHVPAREEPTGRKSLLFAEMSDEELLAYGVPPEWLNDVRAADEDTILSIADHLPGEAAEALLELAIGGKPAPLQFLSDQVNPFEHPDAKRRFRLMTDSVELARALEYPWEKWTVFLHPEQQDIVEKVFSGPARVSGSAGTGKTIVALHRAVSLTRKHQDSRVLLTTFSKPLANALQVKLRRLISGEPRLAERIEVVNMDEVCGRLYILRNGQPRLASDDLVTGLLDEAKGLVGNHSFSLSFLKSEWRDVVDAWQLGHWEAYRDVSRLGRKTRLPEKQRQTLWEIFSRVRGQLKEKGLITLAEIYGAVTKDLGEASHRAFDYIVVDEAQDVSVAQLRFLAALGGDRPDSLFFAGDLGQRIFQQPFSWKNLGVDIRGRSRTLRINYRTTHQIRTQADRLLASALADVDGNIEAREGTVSVFNGPLPIIQACDNQSLETDVVGNWLQKITGEGVQPGEIGVFVRSANVMERAKHAVEKAGLPYKILDENIEISSSQVSISTMHLAKGLEFRAVVVMACDDEVIPSLERIESVGDDADLEEVYNTERHLLYVACTRARDQLLVTGITPISEFLDDMVA